MDKTSNMDILDELLGYRKFQAIFDALDNADDEQSYNLLLKVRRHFQRKFDLSGGEEAAWSRLVGLIERGSRWDPALIRNNVFKVANSLGMKLPSGMFASEGGTERRASDYNPLLDIISQRDFERAYDLLEEADAQSAELLLDVYQELSKRMGLSRQESDALARLKFVLTNSGRDPALLRNNIFKAANSLGLRLPSGMFASGRAASELERQWGPTLTKQAGGPGYVRMTTLKAIGDLQTAAGGLNYRLFDRQGKEDGNGNPILDPRQRREAQKAYDEIREAEEKARSAAKRLDGLDLKYR